MLQLRQILDDDDAVLDVDDAAVAQALQHAIDVHHRHAEEFAKLLLERAQVAVSPGIGFGPLGEGHVRFALVENEQRIRQATRSIGQFLKE